MGKKKKVASSNFISSDVIESKIFLLRGHKVMLSPYWAKLYGVATRVLAQAVKRNSERFPEDFCFQLSEEEYESLNSMVSRSQTVILKRGHNVKYLPYAFTEQGVAMLSSVLRSKMAIQVNIAIMRAFVKLKQNLSTHKDIVNKLNEMERKIEKHDTHITAIFTAIRHLMSEESKPKRRIGFHAV